MDYEQLAEVELSGYGELIGALAIPRLALAGVTYKNYRDGFKEAENLIESEEDVRASELVNEEFLNEYTEYAAEEGWKKAFLKYSSGSDYIVEALSKNSFTKRHLLENKYVDADLDKGYNNSKELWKMIGVVRKLEEENLIE